MVQRHSIVTVVGRNKEAAKTAANEAVVFTEIALGDGDRYPSGGETALENELHRGAITNSGVEAGQPDAAWFDLYVPAAINTFYAQEIGLFDEDGVLYAISRFDQPVPKFGPDSSSLSDNTFRIVVVFSDTENVVVHTNPITGVTGARQINTNTGLAGGGNLSVDRTLVTDWSNLTVADDIADLIPASLLNMRLYDGQRSVTLGMLVDLINAQLAFADQAEFDNPATTGLIPEIAHIHGLINGLLTNGDRTFILGFQEASQPSNVTAYQTTVSLCELSGYVVATAASGRRSITVSGSCSVVNGAINGELAYTKVQRRIDGGAWADLPLSETQMSFTFHSGSTSSDQITFPFCLVVNDDDNATGGTYDYRLVGHAAGDASLTFKNGRMAISEIGVE